MAMDGTVLGKKIVKALLGRRIKDMSKEDLKTMEKSWITISNQIIDHIRSESKIQIEPKPSTFPVTSLPKPIEIQGEIYTLTATGIPDVEGRLV